MFDFKAFFKNNDEDDDFTFEELSMFIEQDEEMEYKNHVIPREIYKDIFGYYESEE